MRVLLVVATTALAVVVSSCSREGDREARVTGNGSKHGQVLAVVGAEKITVADFKAELELRARVTGNRYSSAEKKHALLDEMIEFKVLLARAREAGYEQRPEIRARLDQFLVGSFREDHLATNDTAMPISDTDTHAFYESNPSQFATPETIRVAMIYFKSSPKASPEKREEVWQRAGSVLEEARRADADGFSGLARRYSDDHATRYTGGDIGWLTRDADSGNLSGAFQDAAFALAQPGEIAPLVETPHGFYIVRLIEKKPAGVRPFAEVKDAIAYQLARERQQERHEDFFEQMKKGLKIESDPSLLDNISAPARVSEKTPPALPRG